MLIILFLYELVFRDLSYLFILVLNLMLFTDLQFPYLNLLLIIQAFVFLRGLPWYLNKRFHLKLGF